MPNRGKYNLKNLKRVLSNPSTAMGVLSNIAEDINCRYYKNFHSLDGTCVVEEDWDTLIILDGCRYDLYKESQRYFGNLKKKVSRASESLNYIRENFQGRNLHETVYVTSNPYARDIDQCTFHALIDEGNNSWDPDLRTIPPEPVADRIIEAHRNYDNKRIIGHFMQPHYPFIGEFGRSLHQAGFKPGSNERGEEGPIWRQLMYNLNNTTKDDVWKAYAENLELVLEHVKRIIDNIEGKIVVTADHGNLVGDLMKPIPLPGYGHPKWLHVPELVEVPWDVIENGPRRDIISEEPVLYEADHDEDIENKLEHLGYMT